jgi:hypothetical protein
LTLDKQLLSGYNLFFERNGSWISYASQFAGDDGFAWLRRDAVAEKILNKRAELKPKTIFERKKINCKIIEPGTEIVS